MAATELQPRFTFVPSPKRSVRRRGRARSRSSRRWRAMCASVVGGLQLVIRVFALLVPVSLLLVVLLIGIVIDDEMQRD